MKQIKQFALSLFVIFFMMFSFNVSAEISYATQNYLDNKDFRTAKISIESDIKKDKFDAKTWYFYSRILYQLNQPNAAKNALNNAMNIDKTGSFAKGGMSNVRSFAGDIMNKIKNTSYEDPVSMSKITGAEYDRYLTSVFGANNSYSNQNPPSASAIKSALAKNSVSTPKVENSVKQVNSNVQTPPVMSVPVNDINKNTQKSESKSSVSSEDVGSGGFLKGFMIFVAFVVAIALITAYFIQNKGKKEESLRKQKIKDRIVEVFNKFNNLSNKIEEKMKDYEVMAPGTKLYEAMSQLYTESLNYIKEIDLNDLTEESINKINNNMKKVNEYMVILETAYNEKDYDLSNYFKRLEEEAERKRKEEERQAEIRRKNEERARIEQLERDRIAREERIKREEREAEIEKERIRTGYYERKREQEAQEQRELEARRERERERQRQSSRHSSSRGGSSRVNDMVTGAALFNVADSLLNSGSKKSNNDDSNDSVWSSNSSSRSNDDDNSSIWGSGGSSRDDSNDSLWGGGGNSNDSDDSSKW